MSTIRVGSAPDSWGVWFPDDPQQTTWTRFLDEVRDAGYPWVELGPYGYLPTDPAQLKRLGDLAVRKKIYAAYHTHAQGSMTAFEVEAYRLSRYTTPRAADSGPLKS